MTRRLKIALVAGEASGDILGAGLMRELKRQHSGSQIQFIGVGGSLMQAQGLNAYFPMERLSVMGLVEVLGRLPELLLRRRKLIKTLLTEKPDVFIGVDSPDFTLTIERKLREKGIKTVHYVSPSVWAWRKRRVFKIQKACDLMLTLLPFEARFYQEHQVQVRFVGHPMADSIALENSMTEARTRLGVDEQRTLIALMPGSRGGEIAKLGELFIQTAAQLLKERKDLEFIIPAASAERKAQLQEILTHYQNLPIRLVDGRSQDVLQACNTVLIASGTATLEAMLFKRPMVVAYRLAPMTYHLLKHMVSTPYFSLPNLLAGRALVPEFIQHEATATKLAQALLQVLQHGHEQTQEFSQLYHLLRRNASQEAAAAVLELVNQHDAD